MFLNSLMLFGISAVSIPIIIHLLNRRKFDRVVWAAMRLLKVSIEQNQRRLKIEDLLLLILRCVLVALLAIALARPVIKAAAGVFGREKVTAVIILDNSYSMSLTDGVQSRFDSAKKAAEDALATLPAGSAASVLLASDIVADLIPEPTFDLTYAAREIHDAPIFDRPTNLAPAVQAAEQSLRGRAGRKEIYIITDGQTSAWRRLNDIVTLFEQNEKDLRGHVVLVGRNEERNLGISGLQLDGGMVAVNAPARLEVQVRNFGTAEARDVGVSISVNGEPPMDQATIPSLPPGEARSVGLFVRLKNDGFHTATARIESDHLPADDVRTLALRCVKEVKVLLIDGERGAEDRESEVFYLKHALRPVPRAEWDNHPVKITITTPTELDAIRFEDFDAIVSANVTDFSQTTLSQLVNYVKGGGGLWIFLGANVNTTFYNEQLHKKHGLLPAAPGAARGDEKTQEKWFSLSDRNYQHPIVSLWTDANKGTLSSAKFFKVIDLIEEKSGTGAESARTVVRFADNRPAVVEKDLSQGRIVLFSSTADTDWNDLGARAGIVIPLVQRTLGHLVARQDEHLTFPVGRAFVHFTGMEFIGKAAQITRAPRPWSGRANDQMAESRTIELINAAPTLNFDDADFAGAYEVRVGDAVIARFAAQPDSEESSLSLIGDEQIQAISKAAHVVRWQPGAVLQEELQQARVGTELWLPLAMIVLALATMETLFAHWFSKSK